MPSSTWPRALERITRAPSRAALLKEEKKAYALLRKDRQVWPPGLSQEDFWRRLAELDQRNTDLSRVAYARLQELGTYGMRNPAWPWVTLTIVGLMLWGIVERQGT